jgi:hypothetical protein
VLLIQESVEDLQRNHSHTDLLRFHTDQSRSLTDQSRFLTDQSRDHNLFKDQPRDHMDQRDLHQELDQLVWHHVNSTLENVDALNQNTGTERLVNIDVILQDVCSVDIVVVQEVFGIQK